MEKKVALSALVAPAVTRMCSGPAGSECSALECVNIPFDPCVFFQEFDLCTVAGNTYYIHVYGVVGGVEECGEYQIASASFVLLDPYVVESRDHCTQSQPGRS